METGFRTFDFKWCIILGSTLIHFLVQTRMRRSISRFFNPCKIYMQFCATRLRESPLLKPEIVVFTLLHFFTNETNQIEHVHW